MTVILALVAGMGAACAQSTLRLSLNQGEVMNERLEATIQMVIGEGSRAIEMSVGAVMGMRYEVKGIDSVGNYAMTMSYTKVGMKTSVPSRGMTIEGSSDDESGNESSAVCRLLIDKPFHMTIAPNGALVDVDTRAMREALERETLAGANPQAAEAMKAQIADSFGEESIRYNLSMTSAVFPDRPVSVGDSWERKASVVQNKMPMDISIRYTLVEANVVELTGDIIVNGNGAELTGTMEGRIELNPVTRWNKSVEILMSVKGSIKGSAISMISEMKMN